ncbi:MAG TPA: pentapeptide repeat-containing protein, partial [Nocardioides sp.]|nr:pentapeptide repeat-containing protein [Nocardioides sp.]
MTDFSEQDLGGSSFLRVNLSGSTFREAHMTGLDVRDVDLSRTRIRSAYLDGVRMTGVEVPDLEIHGEIGRLLVNGVDVAPLVEAERDRRTPERALMRPS